MIILARTTIKNIKEKHFNKFYETIHKKGAVCLIFKKINKHMQKIVNKTKIKTNYNIVNKKQEREDLSISQLLVFHKTH